MGVVVVVLSKCITIVLCNDVSVETLVIFYTHFVGQLCAFAELSRYCFILESCTLPPTK